MQCMGLQEGVPGPTRPPARLTTESAKSYASLQAECIYDFWRIGQVECISLCW